MKRLTIILLFFASVLQGQTGAGYWHGSTEPGTITPEPDTLTLTYWNDFILLHIANTGITETGSGVSEWQDRSGNGNHSTQTVDTNRPTVDGSGNVVFDGVDNYLTNTSNILSEDTSFTVFVVALVSTGSGRKKIIDYNWYDASDSLAFQLQYDDLTTTFEVSYQVDDNSTNVEINIDTFSYSTLFLSTIAASQTTTTQARINGVQKSTYSNDGTWSTPFPAGADAFSIGATAAGTAQYLNGKIYFIGIANRKFTPAEIATTESELNSFFTIY